MININNKYKKNFWWNFWHPRSDIKSITSKKIRNFDEAALKNMNKKIKKNKEYNINDIVKKNIFDFQIINVNIVKNLDVLSIENILDQKSEDIKRYNLNRWKFEIQILEKKLNKRSKKYEYIGLITNANFNSLWFWYENTELFLGVIKAYINNIKQLQIRVKIKD